MLTFDEILKIKTLFHEQKNIIQYIKSKANLDIESAILHSYDLQAGSYISELSDQEQKTLKKSIGIKLANLIKKLDVHCICEAGVGEATTLCSFLSSINIEEKFGFDISLSRLLYAQRYLKENKVEADLFCAELSHVPFPNDSIECIYTHHSLEPNGGKEKRLLKELLRITKKYLILIEPDYAYFGEEQRKRMDQHGYCKFLPDYLTQLDADIICYEPWELDSNPLNKASLIIVKKTVPFGETTHVRYVSPISQKILFPVTDGWFCKEDGFLFPSVKNVPIFLKEKAILASHYDYFA